jgi:hypothetical protein
MATNQLATTLALPRLVLFVKKLFNSMVFDEIQILYHTHSVTRFVPCANCFQSIAWKAGAFKAKSHFAI